MITEKACVKEIIGNSVVLESKPASGCASCQANKVCAQGLMSQYGGEVKSKIQINSISGDELAKMQVGEFVLIGIEEFSLVTAAFYAYMIPLISALLFLLFTQIAGVNGEGYQILATVIGLFFGMLASRLLLRKNETNSSLESRLMPELLDRNEFDRDALELLEMG